MNGIIFAVLIIMIIMGLIKRTFKLLKWIIWIGILVVAYRFFSTLF